jgi:T5SS/PEP-CTERM-associated repeat protein
MLVKTTAYSQRLVIAFALLTVQYFFVTNSDVAFCASKTLIVPNSSSVAFDLGYLWSPTGVPDFADSVEVRSTSPAGGRLYYRRNETTRSMWLRGGDPARLTVDLNGYTHDLLGNSLSVSGLVTVKAGTILADELDGVSGYSRDLTVSEGGRLVFSDEFSFGRNGYSESFDVLSNSLIEAPFVNVGGGSAHDVELNVSGSGSMLRATGTGIQVRNNSAVSSTVRSVLNVSSGAEVSSTSIDLPYHGAMNVSNARVTTNSLSISGSSISLTNGVIDASAITVTDTTGNSSDDVSISGYGIMIGDANGDLQIASPTGAVDTSYAMSIGSRRADIFSNGNATLRGDVGLSTGGALNSAQTVQVVGAEYTQSGGTTTIGGQFAVDNAVARVNGGSLNVTAEIQVGRPSGSSSLLQTDGAINSDSHVSIGSGALGVYDISGGSLTTTGGGELIVGETSVSTGQVIQTGGVISVNELTLANLAGAEASYDLQAGTINTRNRVHVGWKDAATYTQSGGDVNVAGQFRVDHGSMATINDGAIDATDSIRVGVTAGTTSTMKQTGGLVKTNEYFAIGSEGSGSYELTGGTLEAKAVDRGLGVGSTGATVSASMTQSGGLVDVGELVVGHANGLASTYTMSDGNIAARDRIVVGNHSVGTFSQSGGVINATNAPVTVGNVVTSDGSQYGISGGTLNTNSLVVGNYGDATFTQTNGDVNADSVVLAQISTSTSSYSLQGGALTTKNAIAVGGGVGTFTHTGGTLIFDGANFNKGGTTKNLSGAATPTEKLANAATATYGDVKLGGANGESGGYSIFGGSSLDLSSNADVFIGDATGASGTFTVDGAGSKLNPTSGGNQIYVGNNGNGQLTVQNGGLVEGFSSYYIGYGSGSTGTMTITGAGSTARNGLYYLGSNGGTATIRLEDGGRIESTGTIYMYLQSANSKITIDGGSVSVTNITVGDGTVEFLDGNLSVGAFLGDLEQNGGTLAPGNSPGLTYIQGDYTIVDGTVEIELGGYGRGIDFDVIDIGGHATLGGMLDVSLINGFTPNIGDTFQVVNFGSASGNFDTYTGLDLGNGLTLAPTLDSGGLTLTAVPEPTSLLLGLVGLVGLATCGRRRKSGGTPTR